MKRIFVLLFLLLIIGSIKAQINPNNVISVVNSTTTALDSAATFTGTAEDVSNFTSILVTYRSNRASATNGVKFQFSTNKTTWDNYRFKTYAANDTLTNYTVLVPQGKYFRVLYTNTTFDQTYFRLQTIFFKGSVFPLDATGSIPVSITGSAGSALATELTQADNKTALQAIQKRVQQIRPSGIFYYSNLEGDFTATPKAATAKVAISGLGFTLDQKDVVYATVKRLAGDWTYLGMEPTILGTDTLVFGTTSFVSTDQVDIVIIGSTAKTRANALEATQLEIKRRNTADSLNFVAIKTLTDSLKTLITTIKGRLSDKNLEATQLLILAQVQDKINMGGTQTYSVRRGDITGTLKVGGKSIAITGLAGNTVNYLNFASAWLINSTTGVKTYLTNAIDSVAGTSIQFPTATAFTASDVLGELVFIYPEKTIDKALDVGKVIEQAPNWARYSSDVIATETSSTVGRFRYDYSMEGYNYQTFQFDLSATSGGGLKIFASEWAVPSTTAETALGATGDGWVDMTRTITGSDSLAFSTATSQTFTVSVPLQMRWFRVRVYTGHATHNVSILVRRWF